MLFGLTKAQPLRCPDCGLLQSKLIKGADADLLVFAERKEARRAA
jgi:hypothetical protein